MDLTDYGGNSKKAKNAEPRPPKVVEKVVTGPVVVAKKPLGRKIKDLFIEADFRSVVRYVAMDVLIPAARNMIYEGASKGVERMMFGENSQRLRSYGYGGAPRITYNTPVNRMYPDARDVISRSAPPVNHDPRTGRQLPTDFILSSKEEAEMVLERMNDIIDQYQVASAADLKELMGIPHTPIDRKWGWVYLGNTTVIQTSGGFLIDLPPAEPISNG
jgi:hypothetical protein